MKNIYRIILALALATMVVCSWLAPMDSFAAERVDAGLKRALTSFATARALNAVISVVQGTEVAIEPMGVGVTLSLGQVLDPINDLIEQFSSLMLIASVALGIQKVLISIGGYWPISLVMTLGTIAWAWLYFRQKKSPAWLSKILLILFLIRFTMPIVTIGADLLFQKFLAADFNVSQRALDSAPSQVTSLKLFENQTAQAPKNQPAPVPPKNVGAWNTLKNVVQTGAAGVVNTAKNTFQAAAHPREFYERQFNKISESAHQWTEHVIKIIVVFLLQTLIIPVLLSWVLYAVARGLFELPSLNRNRDMVS